MKNMDIDIFQFINEIIAGRKSDLQVTDIYITI